ncbi:hypothetical protein [Tessaracoccus lapidicaptus]|uniref:hypothetical protein n=1 Tax=Tessaracoccus lapidicaptus TaxID=1427523 RepID=UPI0033422043
MGLVLLSGWGIDGQAQVASSKDSARRKALYATSLTQRAKLALVVLPVAASAGVLVARGELPYTHAAMAAAGAWSGFGLGWYAIGCGQAGWIARYETIPRLGASVLAAAAVATFAAVWVYPVSVIVLTSLGVLLFNRAHAGALWPRTSDRMGMAGSSNVVAGLLSLVGAAYSGAPLPVSQAVQVSNAPGLASADRLYRYALFAVTSLANALQQWVLAREGAALARSRRVAVLMHAALGLVGGLAFTLFAEPLGAFIFGAAVAPDTSVAAGYGAAFFFVSTATPLTRNFLVPQGRTPVVLLLASTSAVIGVAFMVVGGKVWGAAGLAWALAVADGFFLLGALVAMRSSRSVQ